jgi:linoleate 9S-lipoxygenase
LARHTDPTRESRPTLVNGDVYVPRDERFGHIKKSDFYAYAIKALVTAVVPAIKRLSEGDLRGVEFDSFKDITRLYEGGIQLPKIPALEELRKLFPLQLVKSVLPVGGDYLLKHPMPQLIKGRSSLRANAKLVFNLVIPFHLDYSGHVCTQRTRQVG